MVRMERTLVTVLGQNSGLEAVALELLTSFHLCADLTHWTEKTTVGELFDLCKV